VYLSYGASRLCFKRIRRRVNVDTGRDPHFVANRDGIGVVKQIVAIIESSIADGEVEAIRSTCDLTIPLPPEP
jgi:hypothetical protein